MKKPMASLAEYENPRIVEVLDCNAVEGKVTWSPIKSIWISCMTLIAVIGGYYTASLEAFGIFLLTTVITLCFGHSLGMHRRLIHHSYECPQWLEYIFVYLGVLVGLAGPLGMMYTHDLRDWAQRQKQSHAYFGHKAGFLKDAFWQIHCDLTLQTPPVFQAEEQLENNKVYQFMERYWMWQQLPLALLLFLVGGVAWVVWGVCLRVTVSVLGHWMIGYFAHNKGHRDWHVDGASVQGYNIRFCGLLTMGECWHNNHHAFPGSALLGIHPDQIDPGWWVLKRLENWGLVWNIKVPENLPERKELVLIKP